MSQTSDYEQTVIDAVLSPGFRRASFGGAARAADKLPWVRVTLRPVDLGGQRHVQFSYFDQKKDVTKNFRGAEIVNRLKELLAARFAGTHVSTATEELDIHVSKKGKILIGRKASVSTTVPPPAAHNRIKDVPLPEGKADRVLEAMGIMTRDGHVRPTMRAKFTQINEFLKLLGHVVTEALADINRPAEILDCGCGSSYLTIATHHYLNEVLGVPARVIGVDVNEEVIRKSIEKTEPLDAEGLTFERGRIGEVQGVRPDIVLALHACDTATDDAVAQAISLEARIVLSVPCCHHDLHEKLGAGEADVLRPITRHGILRQRLADLATDAFRALALRIMGYRTDVIEFVSQEHTARNLMIRAVRGVRSGDPELIAEFRALKRFFGVEPYIEKALPSLKQLVSGQ